MANVESRHARSARAPIAGRSRGGFIAEPPASWAGAPALRRARCPVCRCDEVELDRVDAGFSLHLAECPRCEHRWTSPLPIGREVARTSLRRHDASVGAQASAPR